MALRLSIHYIAQVLLQESNGIDPNALIYFACCSFPLDLEFLSLMLCQWNVLQTSPEQTPWVRKVFLPWIDLVLNFSCILCMGRLPVARWKYIQYEKGNWGLSIISLTFSFQSFTGDRVSSLPGYIVALLAVVSPQTLLTTQEHVLEDQWPFTVLVILKTFLYCMYNICSSFKKINYK